MTELQAVILAVIEGITEFLPVSSTGHMILASSLMGIAQDNFTKLFTIVIQLGTILSVVVLYWRRFLQSWDFYKKLFVAFLPAVFLGLLLNKFIDRLLENPIVVAIMLILGGFVFLKVDDWFKDNKETNITYSKALKIGFFQTLAMIPGVSRSGATIIGGMMQKLDRKTATEFSFFLAVPTMLGATVKKLWDYYQEGYHLDPHQIKLLLIGNIVGFVVALFAIKAFINYITKKGFKVFGYYRIIIGLVILFIHFFIKPLIII
jgi:undecaprenyl-diphosphatase